MTIVEPAPQPLADPLGEEVGAWFAELHRSHGVEVRTGTGLSGLNGGHAVLDDETTIAVDLVVIGIGAIPNDTLAREAGLDVDNVVFVDASLVTSDPDVLAIGDVAAHLHPVLRERSRVEHWQNAPSQAQIAAEVLADQDAPYTDLPSFFSDQYDSGLEFFGHLGKGPADVTFNDTNHGFVARWHQNGKLVATGHVNQWDPSEALAQEVANAR